MTPNDAWNLFSWVFTHNTHMHKWKDLPQSCLCIQRVGPHPSFTSTMPTSRDLTYTFCFPFQCESSLKGSVEDFSGKYSEKKKKKNFICQKRHLRRFQSYWLASPFLWEKIKAVWLAKNLETHCFGIFRFALFLRENVHTKISLVQNFEGTFMTVAEMSPFGNSLLFNSKHKKNANLAVGFSLVDNVG